MSVANVIALSARSAMIPRREPGADPRVANRRAVALAEGGGGSIENFAGEMNRAAQRLGMTQSSFVNPNGLPDENQFTSARDLAILARALIREFPEYDLYWHIPAIKLGKRVIRN